PAGLRRVHAGRRSGPRPRRALRVHHEKAGQVQPGAGWPLTPGALRGAGGPERWRHPGVRPGAPDVVALTGHHRATVVAVPERHCDALPVALDRLPLARGPGRVPPPDTVYLPGREAVVGVGP